MKCGGREKKPQRTRLGSAIYCWRGSINESKGGSKVEGPFSRIATPATLELKGPGDDWSVQSSPISFSHARALHFYNNIKAEEGT